MIEGYYTRLRIVTNLINADNSMMFMKDEIVVFLSDLPNGKVKVMKLQDPHDKAILDRRCCKPFGIKTFPVASYENLKSKLVRCMKDHTAANKREISLAKGDIVKIISRDKGARRNLFLVEKGLMKGYIPYNLLNPNEVTESTSGRESLEEDDSNDENSSENSSNESSDSNEVTKNTSGKESPEEDDSSDENNSENSSDESIERKWLIEKGKKKIS